VSVTRDERMAVLARRMQGVFDVRWGPGESAGTAFEAAREAVAKGLQIDLELAGQMTFEHFRRTYLPADVTPETVKAESA
jgi:hypothetical protein